jgi:hypothetical protein
MRLRDGDGSIFEVMSKHFGRRSASADRERLDFASGVNAMLTAVV